MASRIFKRNQIKNVAKEILAMKPDIVALEGSLGAGKTTLVKAIAKEVGIKDIIVSPTFVLSAQYSVLSTQITLDHIDAWRVEDFSEIERLGLSEMIKNKHLVVVEWADMFAGEIKRLSNEDTKIVWVKMDYGEEENERIITVTHP